MKKTLQFFIFIISVSVYSQYPGEIWYLETLNYEEVNFNEEIPEIKAEFGVDDEGGIFLQTSVCGNLKVSIDFLLCSCDEFDVLEILEYNDEACVNPENTLLQQNYFNSFIGAEGMYVNFGYERENLGNGIQRLTLYGSNDTRLTFLSGRLSIHDVVTENEVQIHPNPVKDVLNFSEEVSNVEIFTFSGNKIYTSGEMQRVNVSDLNKGIYIVKFRSKKGLKQQLKFIKE